MQIIAEFILSGKLIITFIDFKRIMETVGVNFKVKVKELYLLLAIHVQNDNVNISAQFRNSN